MTYLVTGSQGCIGTWILKKLVERGTRTVAFDTDLDTRRLAQVLTPDQIAAIRFVRGDVRDGEALAGVMRGEAITHVVHLAGVQVPTCRRDPALGAAINVIGTLNVFEAVKRAGGVQGLVYASSAAVLGPEEAYGAGPVANDAALLPRTHYGVFKQCNEGNARIYFQDDNISSAGLRPLTVYGPGRDVGMTADITKAIKAAAVGRPFHIRFGGRTDLQFAGDTAEAFVRCAEAGLPGARVYNLQGAVVRVTGFIARLEQACPEAHRTITCGDAQLPIAPELDDAVMLADMPGFVKTPLDQGISLTLATFRRLCAEGRLDVSDLDV